MWLFFRIFFLNLLRAVCFVTIGLAFAETVLNHKIHFFSSELRARTDQKPCVYVQMHLVARLIQM